LIAPPVDENKNITAQQRELHLLLYQPSESVKGFTHIGYALV
jgi:hypothetical protein